MNFKELPNMVIDFIDSNRKSIVTASLSILGVILLMVTFFFSSDEFSVGNEANTLVRYIEQRQYSIAIDYYESCENKFSDSKMNRLNKSLSHKISKLLLESGDKYISGDITKENYTGLINTINVFEKVGIDDKSIINQASRVNEMYQNENINYEEAISYINIVSILDGINGDLNLYKYEIEEIYQSRQVYNLALEKQQDNNYYEAIELYERVLEKDKKYYGLANKNKEDCVELMYEYYIVESEVANSNGNYEEALQYIEYVKEYYPQDSYILELESQYKENLSLYTLTQEDILNLVATKTGKKKESLSITSYQQMVESEKYYYVEVFEYDKLIDEVLIDARTKSLYSYKDSYKDYKSGYSDGYFRVKTDGSIEFAISEDKAQFILREKLEENETNYRSMTTIEKNQISRYINSKIDIDEILGEESNLFYYQLLNKGAFRGRQVFLINMYTEEIYVISDDSIVDY